MPTITLPHGDVHYRQAGPSDGRSAAPPVVFVHGVLVDSTLWSGVADALAAAGVTSYAPDLPLGAHRIPVAADTDQSPRGVARQILAFLDALGLEDVTLVGNDSGGAISQYLIDTDPTRIGRLVLTNCDAFEQFPPPQLHRFITLLGHPAALALASWAMRSTRIRHGRLGFGPFADRLDAAMTRAWIEPAADRKVRRDVSRLIRVVDPKDLVAVGARLSRFTKPVRLVWGNADPFFTLDLARRLLAAFPDAELVEVPGARTFVPLDAPDRVAAEILRISPNCPPEPAGSARSAAGRTSASEPAGDGCGGAASTTLRRSQRTEPAPTPG